MGTRIVFYLIVSYLLAGLRQSHQALSTLSSIDSLDGLTNRRAFLNLWNRDGRHRQAAGCRWPTSIWTISSRSTTERAQEGDEVLRTVAKVLGQTLETDIIGRLGGDEFAILMPRPKVKGHWPALSVVRSNTLGAMAEQALRVIQCGRRHCRRGNKRGTTPL